MQSSLKISLAIKTFKIIVLNDVLFLQLLRDKNIKLDKHTERTAMQTI